MCGIAGFWDKQNYVPVIAEQMAAHIANRGPDDAGVWGDEAFGLVLAHRRLSILDLSPAGHQPMVSPCRRFTLVYNGEIYNHLDLRRELEAENGAFAWRGHSDTETLLAGLCHWGVKNTLEKLNGMFAFAFWDAGQGQLFLARDRMGEKPLYYGRSGRAFIFGSELKALMGHPGWQGEINRDALALYMRHNYVPAPWSIYQGIAKLLPAHYVVIRNEGQDVSGPHCYWDLGAIAEQGMSQNAGDEMALIDQLDDLLQDAVGRRMAADVPLGAFLSGGYDSTTVAALMQARSARKVKTFSIGFHEHRYNEAQHAKAVAEYLGTEHTELYVSADEAMSVIPQLPMIYDEPFADPSQIPTYLVSKLAKQHVTVSLSGDGGDELFYGYDRYLKTQHIWSKLNRTPLPLRRMASRILPHLPIKPIEMAMTALPRRLQIEHFADRILKFTELLTHLSGEALYRAMVSQCQNPSQLVVGASEPDTVLNTPAGLPNLPSLRERMMYLDMASYLPGDILTKVDRASMAVSLEARVPLLDHRLVEFSWRVPTRFKYREGQGKWLLRQVLYRYVPRQLMERPKMGFGVPIEHWLRGPLLEWGEELLSEKRLREDGYFNAVPIRKMWREHIVGKRRWHSQLWSVLMFQAWLEKYRVV